MPTARDATDGDLAPDARLKLWRNELLKVLPPAGAQHVGSRLEVAHLRQGQIVAHAGESLSHVYFPETCLISMVVRLPDGRLTDAGIIGREGFVGLPILLGTDPNPHALVCQVSGEALRMPAQRLRSTLRHTAGLQNLLLRYAGVRLIESAQLLACNASHRLMQRLARWLLVARDRIGAEQFDLTQDFLAQMLAVGRPYLNTASKRLQLDGCIQYHRGRIAILDEAALEVASCTDYRLLRDEYARLLSSRGDAT